MDKFIEENPNLTFDELKKEFPDSMTTGVPNRGLIVEETLDLGSYIRYYSPKNYKSADGVLFKIFKQWTIRNVDNIIAFAQKQNWTVEEQGKWERKNN